MSEEEQAPQVEEEERPAKKKGKVGAHYIA